MKKYCFTQCFKNKMSKGLDTALQIGLGFIVLIVFVALCAIFFGGLGWVLIQFGLGNPKEYVETGIAFTVMAGVAGWILYLIFLGGRGTYRSAYKFTKARIEGEEFKCSIFEECIEEPEEEQKV